MLDEQPKLPNAIAVQNQRGESEREVAGELGVGVVSLSTAQRPPALEDLPVGGPSGHERARRQDGFRLAADQDGYEEVVQAAVLGDQARPRAPDAVEAALVVP